MKEWFNNIILSIKKLWNKYVLINVQLSSSAKEIQEKYIKQRDNKDWTLYSERTFIEQLFSTRFNYFIATFSLLTAAVARIESPQILLITLFLSAIILTLMSLAIYRIYVKLIIILKMLYQLEDYHVFNLVQKEVNNVKNKISIPVNAIIGVIIPFIGSLSFWIYFVYQIVYSLNSGIDIQ